MPARKTRDGAVMNRMPAANTAVLYCSVPGLEGFAVSKCKRLAALSALLVLNWTGIAASQPAPSPRLQAFRDIYQELVEINTTESAGDTVRAAEAMAARLRAGGIPAGDIRVLSSGPRKGN